MAVTEQHHKSAPWKLGAVKKDMGSAILIEQSLQYTDFNC